MLGEGQCALELLLEGLRWPRGGARWIARAWRRTMPSALGRSKDLRTRCVATIERQIRQTWKKFVIDTYVSFLALHCRPFKGCSPAHEAYPRGSCVARKTAGCNSQRSRLRADTAAASWSHSSFVYPRRKQPPPYLACVFESCLRDRARCSCL